MSDLNTEIKIGADASGVEAGVGKAKRSLKDLGDAAQKAGKDAGAGIGSIGAGGDKAAKDIARSTKNMQSELQRLLATQQAGAKGSREYYEALADTRGISRNAIKPILDQIDAAKSKTLQAKTAADSWTASLGKVAPLVAAAFSGAAITGFLGKAVSVQREFDVLNSSLKTVTGSSAAAEREMAWLKDFAKETPFGLAQATQGFVKMKALGLDPTRAALTSFGNTASAMGKDLNQMIEAVADASTGEFERLKEFGIKAKKEGDNVSLTFQGVTKTIGNSAREITKYLEDIGNTSFGGSMEERAKTLDGTIAALGDTWDELFRTVSTNNVGGLIFDSVTLANGVLEDATTIIRAMGGAVGETSREFGSLSAIQGGVATFFETVSVLAVNTLYVLRQTGDTMAGVAAGYKAFFSFDFDAVRAIGAEMKANGEAARKEIDATTARILNARKAQEEYARYATRNASAATDPRRVDLGGSAPRATPAGASSGAGRSVKEAISDYDKLIKKLSDELPRAAAEAEAAQMGYNKAQTEFLALAGSPAWASFSNSQRAVVASMFEGKIASEEAGEAAKELSKAYAEAAAERIKTIQSMERAADGLQSQNDALREEIELIGLSTEQQTLVLQQRNDVIILTKEATLAELERQSAITGTQTRVEIALASEIDALKERNALLGAKGVKNAAVDAAKSAADEWQKTTDSINQSLTDSLMRGFESGKDFAKNLRQTVVNMFKTMVLRPVISAIVNPVAGAVTGMLGLSGPANASTGGASMLGNVGSLIGAGSSAFGIGASYGATSLFANGLGATLSAGSSMIGAGSTMSGLGTIAGALGPIALGLGALYTLVKKIDDSGTPHIGAGAVYSEAGGLQQGAGIYNKQTFGMGIAEEYAKGTQEGVSTIAKSLTQTFDGIAKAFGKTAGYEIATAFADDSSKDGAWGSLRISKDGADLLNWNDTRESKWAPREFANGEEGYKEYLAEIAKDTRAVLLDMDLPSWADTMLESIGDAANMDQLAATVQQIGAIQTTFVQLGKTMEGFAGLTDQAFEALMRASGGFESLAANAGTYYENFYSEAEKTAAVTRSVSESLAQVGLAMPATRDEFRALVESQLALGESGAEAVAALLGVSGAFASVVPAAANATASLQAQAEAMEGLQIKLLRAQGNELAAVAIERQKELTALQAFGPAAVAMQQQIYGIMDAMSALESGAAAYFAGVDRQQAAEDYTDQGSDALSKFFGVAADASAGAAASAAQASADAASTAAASWRSAAQSIQTAIDGLRAGTTDAMDPAARYAITKATLDAYTVSALGGDADAASKLAGAANDFLKASESGSTTQAQYLRDRVLAEAKLASVMSSAQAQASVQDTIAASAGAAVSQLEAMNANLTGFASTLYELLSTQYQGSDRGTAEGVASTFGKMQADFDAYFKEFRTGSTYTDAAFNGGAFTRLSGDMAAYTDSDGVISYLRATESILDIAKRIPELRQAWEQQYGLKLPGYAVGTSYVPVTGPALLHEGEAVIPKAFNPWAGGGQGNGEMLAELRALRQTNERLEARLASIEESNRDMATLLDNVTEGGNAMRSEVMA